MWLPCLLLLAAVVRATGQAYQPGVSLTPPNPVRVCVTSYPPYTTDARFVSSIPGPNGTVLEAPIPYQALKAVLYAGYNGNTNIRTFSASDVGVTVTGFDIEFAKLTMVRMLGLNVSFVVLENYPQLYLGLRGGLCDMAISAIETDPLKTLCTASCPSTFSIIGDYGSSTTSSDVGGVGRRKLQGWPGCQNTSGGCNGYSPVTMAAECCLQFGQEYISQGFALMSFTSSGSPDVLAALFNNDVGNACLAMLLISMSAAWLFYLLEGSKNPALGSLPRATLWSLQKFFLDEDKKVRTPAGKALKQVYMASNVGGVCVITSIIAAKLTAALLSVITIDSMSQVTGTLCMESAYPKLSDFVLGGHHPVSVITARIDECVQQLVDGTVQAVITDETHLQWFSTYYGIQGLHLSPTLAPNAFAMAFRGDNTPAGMASAKLMAYINPAVIATRADPDWAPVYNALFTKYFDASADMSTPGEANSGLNRNLCIPVLVLASTSVLVAILTGELFPFLVKPEHRPAVLDALAADVGRDWHCERNEEAENELFLGEVRLGLLKRVILDGEHNEQSIRAPPKRRVSQSKGIPDTHTNEESEHGSPNSAYGAGLGRSRSMERLEERALLQRLLAEVGELRAELRSAAR